MAMLTFIPFPQPEESPGSIIKRFAVNNGCRNLSQIISLGAPARVDDECLTCHAKLPKWIASRAGNYSDRFIAGFYIPTTTNGRIKIKVHDLIVPKQFIRWVGYAHCSECCLCGSENFMKDLKLSITCPIHNRLYLFHCPSCNAKFNKFSPIGNHCRCKARLTSPRCSYDDAASERFILNLFRAKDQESINFTVRALNALGYNYSDPASPTQKNILQASISITTGDKAGIISFLLQLQKWYPNLPPKALCAKLSTIKTPTISQACLLFLDIVQKQENLGSTIRYETPPTPFTLSTEQIRRELNIDTKAWNILKNSIQILRRKNLRRQQHIESSIIEIFELHANIENLTIQPENHTPRIKLPAAAELLGISIEYLKKIIKQGNLTVYKTFTSSLTIDPLELHDFQNKTESLESLRKRTRKASALVTQAMSVLGVTPIATNSTFSRTLLSKSDCNRVLDYLQGRERHKAPVKRGPKKNPGKPFIIDGQEFLTYAAAKTELGLLPASMRVLIRLGIIKPYPVTFQDHVVFPRDELIAFASQHIAPAACAKLLEVKRNLASTILKNCGIHPVVGAPSDHTSSKLYSLHEVENLINEESSRHADDLSINQASAILKLPQSVTHQLILSGVIAANHDDHLSKLFACPDKTENFWSEHVTSYKVAMYFGINRSKVRNLLAQLGVSPVYPPPQKYGTAIYKISDFIATEDQATTTSNTLLSQKGTIRFTPIKDICSEWNISRSGFTRNFISSGYLHPITLNLRLVLNDAETQRINEFLAQNHTPAMIDRIVGHYRGFTQNLIRANIIHKVKNLPPELRKQTYIQTADIYRITALLKK